MPRPIDKETQGTPFWELLEYTPNLPLADHTPDSAEHTGIHTGVPPKGPQTTPCRHTLAALVPGKACLLLT